MQGRIEPFRKSNSAACNLNESCAQIGPFLVRRIPNRRVSHDCKICTKSGQLKLHTGLKRVLQRLLKTTILRFCLFLDALTLFLGKGFQLFHQGSDFSFHLLYFAQIDFPDEPITLKNFIQLLIKTLAGSLK